MANTPILTAQAIIFAINSAIRLSRAMRKAYARSIKGRVLVLPLPAFDPNVRIIKVAEFFQDHPEYRRHIKALNLLHGRAMTDSRFRDDQRAVERYKQYYHYLTKPEEIEGELTVDDVANLLAVRQWKDDFDAPASVLQLVAGTLVELGIDYFLQVPGAVNPHSAKGKVLREFLEAFDQIDFAENKTIKEDLSGILLPNLFAAAAESIGQLSDDLASDPKLQLFVRETAHGIAADIYRKLEQVQDPFEQDEIIRWGQLVTRSMIQHAGTTATTRAGQLFGTNDTVADLVAATGGVLLNAILAPGSEGLQLRSALTTTTLDGMIQASLDIIAAHPNVLTRQQGLQPILAGVADAIGEKSWFEPGFYPELIRLVLEQSAGNLETLWPAEEDGEHLLVLALQQILTLLSEKHSDAPWRSVLTQAHLLEMVYELLDDVVQNPAWITDEQNKGSVLSQCLDVTFRSLRHVEKSQRLQADTIRWLIRLNMHTVATSQQLLNHIQWEDDPERTAILEKALQLIFLYVFPNDAPPQLSRTTLLVDLTEHVLETILQDHPNKRGLVLLDLVLFDSGIEYENGFNAALFDEIADTTLAVLVARPDLVAQHKALKGIIAGIAATLDSAQLREPGLLSSLTQLLLAHTAANAQLIVEAEDGQPRHLLVTAMQIFLGHLAETENDGQWQPTLSPELTMHLLETLLDETVRHPHWVIPEEGTADPLLHEMLSATFNAMAKIDEGDRLNGETLDLLFRLNSHLVLTSPRVLRALEWDITDEQKITVLEYALEIVFAFVFSNTETDTAARSTLLTDLLDYLLSVLLLKYPDERGLILLDTILFRSGIDYEEGFDAQTADELVDAAAQVLAARPELVAQPVALQSMLAGIAGALDGSQLRQPGLLALLTRLILLETAENAELIFDTDEDQPRHLLVIATEQVLRAIAKPPRVGRWKPTFSEAQLVEVLRIIYDTVLANPQWVQNDPLIFLVLEAMFRALEVVPDSRKLPFHGITYLLEGCLDTAMRQRELVTTMQIRPGSHSQIKLRYSLESVFLVIYGASDNEETRWHLSQLPVLQSLWDYYFILISEPPLDKEALDAVTQRVWDVLDLWVADFSKSLEEVVATLEG